MSEIVERFRRMHRDSPRRALIHVPATGASLTVADVWSESQAHARALESCGVRAGGLVLLAIGNRPAAFPFWLACLGAGITVLPVDAGATSREIQAVARRFGAVTAIVPASTGEPDALGVARPFVAGLTAITVAGVVAAPDLCGGAAVLKLTSGSTGLPKATFTTDHELAVDTAHIVEAMDIGPEATQLAAIPLSHAYGLGNLLITALVQGTAVVLRETFVPQALGSDARVYGARVFPGVPFMFEHLASSPPAGGWPKDLRTLVSAGARLEHTTVRRCFDAFGLKVHSFYGTSETGGIAYDDTDERPDETTVGRPMPGVTVALRPEEGAPADGGRVHVAGEAVATRYAGEGAGEGLFTSGGFLTGDFGRFTSGGELMLTGRASLFINVAGRKVQPDEVEQVLRGMPSIADVRVVGAPDATRGQLIVACIVPAGDSRNVLAIRQFCAARLASYKVPRVFIWMDSIPLTERGKTDRVRLAALIHDQFSERLKNGVL